MGKTTTVTMENPTDMNLISMATSTSTMMRIKTTEADTILLDFRIIRLMHNVYKLCNNFAGLLASACFTAIDYAKKTFLSSK